jgi:hypothetical protein
MVEEIQNLRDAIARGLSSSLAVERSMPDRLKLLLYQLEQTDNVRAADTRATDVRKERPS